MVFLASLPTGGYPAGGAYSATGSSIGGTAGGTQPGGAGNGYKETLKPDPNLPHVVIVAACLASVLQRVNATYGGAGGTITRTRAAGYGSGSSTGPT